MKIGRALVQVSICSSEFDVFFGVCPEAGATESNSLSMRWPRVMFDRSVRSRIREIIHKRPITRVALDQMSTIGIVLGQPEVSSNGFSPKHSAQVSHLEEIPEIGQTWKIHRQIWTELLSAPGAACEHIGGNLGADFESCPKACLGARFQET